MLADVLDELTDIAEREGSRGPATLRGRPKKVMTG
jgi:hypothetical protein